MSGVSGKIAFEVTKTGAISFTQVNTITSRHNTPLGWVTGGGTNLINRQILQ